MIYHILSPMVFVFLHHSDMCLWGIDRCHPDSNYHNCSIAMDMYIIIGYCSLSSIN